MIAELKFELPEEQDAFGTALNGWKYLKAIEEFKRYLRNQLKYIDLSDNERAVFEKIKKEFYDMVYEIDG